MPNYIILSAEGTTKTPQDTDIDNLQVLGFADGISAHTAFRTFASENPHLRNSGFDDIIAMELTNDKEERFSLKSLNK